MSLAEALNPNTSAKRLQEILDLDTPELCQAVAINPNSPPQVLLELFTICPLAVFKNLVLDLILLEIPDFYEQLLSRNYAVLIDLENLPSFILEAAINHPDSNIYQALIWRPNLPAYYLAKLAHKEEYRIRKGVAIHKNAPIHILKKLAEDRDYNLRSSLASRQDLPSDLLKKLANDEHYYVRSVITENKNVPIHILEKLAAEPNNEVRCHLASQQHIPTDILEKLVKDRSLEVRLFAAKNSNINSNIFKLLFKDKNYNLDRNNLGEIQDAIEFEIRRLNWTKERAKKCFKEKYNNKSFYSLDREELFEFWQQLRTIDSNSSPISLRENVFTVRLH